MGSACSSSSLETRVESAPLDYKLKKRRPGCSGMFWRSDPTGKTPLMANINWPRDGAVIRGDPVNVNGKLWLRARHVKQLNGSSWIQAPKGAFLPFEYDNHYYLEALET